MFSIQHLMASRGLEPAFDQRHPILLNRKIGCPLSSLRKLIGPLLQQALAVRDRPKRSGRRAHPGWQHQGQAIGGSAARRVNCISFRSLWCRSSGTCRAGRATVQAAIDERARISQPVRAGEHNGDPRCKRSGTAAVLQGRPRRRSGESGRSNSSNNPSELLYDFQKDGPWTCGQSKRDPVAGRVEGHSRMPIRASLRCVGDSAAACRARPFRPAVRADFPRPEEKIIQFTASQCENTKPALDMPNQVCRTFSTRLLWDLDLGDAYGSRGGTEPDAARDLGGISRSTGRGNDRNPGGSCAWRISRPPCRSPRPKRRTA